MYTATGLDLHEARITLQRASAILRKVGDVCVGERRRACVGSGTAHRCGVPRYHACQHIRASTIAKIRFGTTVALSCRSSFVGLCAVASPSQIVHLRAAKTLPFMELTQVSGGSCGERWRRHSLSTHLDEILQLHLCAGRAHFLPHSMLPAMRRGVGHLQGMYGRAGIRRNVLLVRKGRQDGARKIRRNLAL